VISILRHLFDIYYRVTDSDEIYYREFRSCKITVEVSLDMLISTLNILLNSINFFIIK